MRPGLDELLSDKERYAALFRGMPVPAFAWRREDDGFVLVDANDAGVALVGDWVTQRLGVTAAQLFADQPEVAEGIRRCYETRETHGRPLTGFLSPARELRRLEMTYVFAPPDLVLVHALDVTQHHDAQARLRDLAEHDSLTGLANRRVFEERLSREAGAVVLLDIDHFKLVNDSLGHAAGDEVLRSVARALRDRAGSGVTVARLGGDEFALLLDDADVAAATALTSELLTAVRSTTHAVAVTASAGIATFDADRRITGPDALIAADLALYRAKSHGRDRWETSGGVPGESLTWLDRVRRAIDEQRLLLHAQPVVDVRSGEVMGDELLVRMRDEQGAIVEPSSFLPTAEQFGLIREIDRWVIGQAVQRAASGRRVAVNLSARSLTDLTLPDEVGALVAAAQIAPGTITFEFTETAAVSSLADAATITRRLREHGCFSALDDFGTGFGTFVLLKHLPVSALKVDMEFVRDLTTSEDSRRIVRAIVTIAREAGLLVVAEGVEDEGTFDLLAGLGVDYAQGFFLGRPAPL